ncbi:hypothetical protein [Cupriavidus sp. BIC8F]|uniref:hypothetical protein n=1 Tax=Cupriavidus sp. BIC8F TaxID=3079014 RepID=UPI002916E7EC|nr:hypothetical protein [Cupriavidus sp. BIC8F]
MARPLGFYELARYPEARPSPGLLIYRFESPLTSFNADFLRQRILALTTRHEVRWVVTDGPSAAGSAP